MSKDTKHTAVEEAMKSSLPRLVPLDEADQLRVENAALRVELARTRVAEAQRDLRDCMETQYEAMSAALALPLALPDGKGYEASDWQKTVQQYGYNERAKGLMLLQTPRPV